MCIRVKQFIGNNDWISDCYIVSDKEVDNSCIVIDPGAADCKEYVDYIEQNKFAPSYMIITHRHFDHFAGANFIRKRYPSVKLVCGKGCNEAIQNPRLNCSRYMNDHKEIILEAADKIFEGRQSLVWNGHYVDFVPTPGHTSDSVSVIIDNNIFTGDALLRDIPVVTKLPSGDKEQQMETEAFINSLHGYNAWPGHGEAFVIL